MSLNLKIFGVFKKLFTVEGLYLLTYNLTHVCPYVGQCHFLVNPRDDCFMKYVDGRRKPADQFSVEQFLRVRCLQHSTLTKWITECTYWL